MKTLLIAAALFCFLGIAPSALAADKKDKSKDDVIAAVDLAAGTITIASGGEFTTYTARPPIEVTLNKMRSSLDQLAAGMKVTVTQADPTRLSRIAAMGLPTPTTQPAKKATAAQPTPALPVKSPVPPTDRATIEPAGGGKVAIVEEGRPMFDNRKHFWDARRIPPFVRGWSYILANINGGEATCTKTGTIYVLTHARKPNTWGDSIEDALTAKGFGKVSEFSYGDGPGNMYAVLTKRVQAGEKITWGKFGVVIF